MARHDYSHDCRAEAARAVEGSTNSSAFAPVRGHRASGRTAAFDGETSHEKVPGNGKDRGTGEVLLPLM
jgi:hypothetical protein